MLRMTTLGSQQIFENEIDIVSGRKFTQNHPNSAKTEFLSFSAVFVELPINLMS